MENENDSFVYVEGTTAVEEEENLDWIQNEEKRKLEEKANMTPE